MVTIMATSTSTHDISVILQKFQKEEILLDKLLDERMKQKDELQTPKESHVVVGISREDAVKRNKDLLKDLEEVKARLRSKAIFTPTEMQWEKICRYYQDRPALMPTKWRCRNPPVFV